VENNYMVGSAKTFMKPTIQNFQNKTKCSMIVFTTWDRIYLIVLGAI